MATRTVSRARANGKGRTRVLLAGDRFLLLEALRASLRSHMDVAVASAEHRRLEEALSSFDPAVVILDATRLEPEMAIRTVRHLVNLGYPVISVAADSVSVDAARLVGAGSVAVLGLDADLDDFADTIRRFSSGGEAMSLERRYELEKILRTHRLAEQRRWLPFDELTAREQAIFELVYDGLSAHQIADEACVSVNTVRSHIRNILTKLNVNSQLAAVAMARSNNWFETEPMRI